MSIQALQRTAATCIVLPGLEVTAVAAAEPHFVETDSHRTCGGEEDGWAFLLPSGQTAATGIGLPGREVTAVAAAAELGRSAFVVMHARIHSSVGLRTCLGWAATRVPEVFGYVHIKV